MLVITWFVTTVNIVDPLRFYTLVSACQENFKSYLFIHNILNFITSLINHFSLNQLIAYGIYSIFIIVGNRGLP